MKAVIYLRVSTKEQDPELQLKECMTLATSRGYADPIIITEHGSAFRDRGRNRPEYQRIKEMAHRGEVNAVIVWGMDRWVRDMDALLSDIQYFKSLNVKVHSVKDEWVESINLPGVMGEWIQRTIIGLIGMLAQWESERKRDRVNMAFANYKGDSWGRPAFKRNREKYQEVIDLHTQGLSQRKIAKKTGIPRTTVQDAVKREVERVLNGKQDEQSTEKKSDINIM